MNLLTSLLVVIGSRIASWNIWFFSKYICHWGSTKSVFIVVVICCCCWGL